MSRTFHHGKNRGREIRVRGVRREEVDLRRLARAIISFAQAEAEAAAQAEHQAHPDDNAPARDEAGKPPKHPRRRSDGRAA